MPCRIRKNGKTITITPPFPPPQKNQKKTGLKIHACTSNHKKDIAEADLEETTALETTIEILLIIVRGSNVGFEKPRYSL